MTSDITPRVETPRRCVQRISRLERRLRQIDRSHKTDRQASEISALKWAIPILEEYVHFKFGHLPNKRMELWKHEYVFIKQSLIIDNGSKCNICLKDYKAKNLTIDHIIPIDKGGKDEFSNYQLACDYCNQKKGNSYVI